MLHGHKTETSTHFTIYNLKISVIEAKLLTKTNRPENDAQFLSAMYFIFSLTEDFSLVKADR